MIHNNLFDYCASFEYEFNLLIFTVWFYPQALPRFFTPVNFSLVGWNYPHCFQANTGYLLCHSVAVLNKE